MPTKLTFFVVLVALLTLVVVLEFVRRRKLSESFALLWIGVAIGAVVLGVFRTVLDNIANEIGVSYGASLTFVAAILFLLFVSMSLSMHVSRLTERTELLAQEVTFLRGLVGADPGAPGPILSPSGRGPDRTATPATDPRSVGSAD